MIGLEIIGTVILVALVIAGVAYAAYCQDVALQEWRESQNAAGDCLTPADLIRMGIVNNDGTVRAIDRAANPWWNDHVEAEPVSTEALERAWRECMVIRQPDAHYQGVPIYWDTWSPPSGDDPIRSVHFGYNSAVPGRDGCGQPTEQVANSSDPVNGLPRGGGLGDWVAPDPEATPSSRASGEAAGHD